MSDRPTPIQLDSMLERALKAERKIAELTELWEKSANAYLIEKGRHEATLAKLAEAREALQWARENMGKHTRPSPIDRALASIDAKGKETA